MLEPHCCVLNSNRSRGYWKKSKSPFLKHEIIENKHFRTYKCFKVFTVEYIAHIYIIILVSEQAIGLFYITILSNPYIHLCFPIFIRPSWYGVVRLSVRTYVCPYYICVVHNSCGQDIARTMWSYNEIFRAY